jgi:hypothetical protein
MMIVSPVRLRAGQNHQWCRRAVIGRVRQRQQIIFAHATDHDAIAGVGAGSQRLPSTKGTAISTPSTPVTRVCDVTIIVKGPVDGLQDQMAVDAENLVQKFGAKAVHHRHHDNERRDAQHDPKEREAGDNGDEGLFAPSAQIAQRDHPFKAGEWPGFGGLAAEPSLVMSL